MNCSDYDGDDFAMDGAERDTLLRCGCGNAVHVDSTPVVRIDGSAEFLCPACWDAVREARINRAFGAEARARIQALKAQAEAHAVEARRERK